MGIEIVKFLNHLGQGTVVDSLSALISNNFLLIVLWAGLAVAALIFDKMKGKKVFIAIVIALALNLAVSEGIFKIALPKLGISEVRPYLAHPNEIISLGKQNTDSSFPSNHMSSTVAALGVLIYFYRKAWPWAALFALAMAFSRMHNGMHYPVDILAGAIFGLLYAYLALKIMKFYENSAWNK